jgi:hypothetical protein
MSKLRSLSQFPNAIDVIPLVYPDTPMENHDIIHNTLAEAVMNIEAALGTDFDATVNTFAVVSFGDTAPLVEHEGQLWYDTLNLQMFVSYEGTWAPVSVPPVNNASTTVTGGTEENPTPEYDDEVYTTLDNLARTTQRLTDELQETQTEDIEDIKIAMAEMLQMIDGIQDQLTAIPEPIVKQSVWKRLFGSSNIDEDAEVAP